MTQNEIERNFCFWEGWVRVRECEMLIRPEVICLPIGSRRRGDSGKPYLLKETDGPWSNSESVK